MIYNTEQRNLLLTFLSENPDKKFSVKEIEKALADKHISKSAVYRNLADLEAAGKVKRHSKPGSRETFFQFYDLQSCRNHIHLSCIKCGKIYHMENQIADTLVNEVVSSEGFEINKGETTLYGICKECNLKFNVSDEDITVETLNINGNSHIVVDDNRNDMEEDITNGDL